MPPSEVEKLFRAFVEERKRELLQFTPDGIPITLENKFEDAIYHYLYTYWKEQSGEYDPKDDEIIMTKERSFTKNEKKFEQGLLQQYGMTKKEQRGYTLEGNLDSLWEIFSAADMVLLVKTLPNIGKNLVQLGKNVGDDVAEETVEKTVKTEVTEEVVENTAKKEVADTTEDLSRKHINKDDTLDDSSCVNRENGTVGDGKDGVYIPKDADGNPILLNKQRVNNQDIPLPDPEATGSHTVLGGKESSKTGEIYRQSAAFPKGTWSTANGQNVPWSEVYWTDHSTPQHHTNPHQHIFNYDFDNHYWKREKPTKFFK